MCVDRIAGRRRIYHLLFAASGIVATGKVVRVRRHDLIRPGIFFQLQLYLCTPGPYLRSSRSLPAWWCFIAETLRANTAKQQRAIEARPGKHGEAGRKRWWKGGRRGCGQAAAFLGRRVLTCGGGRAPARGHHEEVVAVEKPHDDEDRLRRCGGRDRRCHRANRRRLGLLAERDADLLVFRRYARATLHYTTNNIRPSVVVFGKPVRAETI